MKRVFNIVPGLVERLDRAFISEMSTPTSLVQRAEEVGDALWAEPGAHAQVGVFHVRLDLWPCNPQQPPSSRDSLRTGTTSGTSSRRDLHPFAHITGLPAITHPNPIADLDLIDSNVFPASC